MNIGHSSRRNFLLSSLSGLSTTWLAVRWPAVLLAQARAASSSKNGEFQFLAPAHAAEVEAMAAQIVPTDDAPGAREARVIYFIDQVLVTFDRDKQPVYTTGLADLQRRTQQLFPDAKSFSSLRSPQQIQLLTAIEKSEFFELVRLHTIMGYLSRPEYGGNYNAVGWKLIGFEDQMTYDPPFGYYDAEEKKGR